MIDRLQAAIERWLAPRLSGAYRSGSPEKLIVEAQLVDKKERPMPTMAGTLATEEIALTVACGLADPAQTVAIDVKEIPEGWNSVRLILVDTDALVDLGWTTVDKGCATFHLYAKKDAWIDAERLSAQDFVVVLRATTSKG